MMQRQHLANILLGWMLALVCLQQAVCLPLAADEPKKDAKPETPKFLRLHRDADGEPLALQTAILR